MYDPIVQLVQGLFLIFLPFMLLVLLLLYQLLGNRCPQEKKSPLRHLDEIEKQLQIKLDHSDDLTCEEQTCMANFLETLPEIRRILED